MSSGALLLKQLQARQRQQTARARVDPQRSYCDTSRYKATDEATINDTTGHQSAGSSSTVDQGKEVLDSLPADGGIDNGNKAVTIEVCLGPDCSGSGGGAALLEIESLVMGRGEKAGNSSKCNIRVVGGGCRDHCTMGPNGHIQSNSIAAEDSHFTRVNSPEECRHVVRVATDASSKGTRDDNSGEDDNTNNIAKILQKREDGRRWRMLREKAAKERRLRVRERATQRLEVTDTLS